MKKRKTLRIGIPRVLNIYTYAPLFNGYFESLGVQPENIVYSDFTEQELYRAGASRGAIDPCFPAKIGIPHVHNLIYRKSTRKKPLDVDLLPHVRRADIAAGEAHRHQRLPHRDRDSGNREGGVHQRERCLRENNVKYIDPVLNFADRKLLRAPDVAGVAAGPGTVAKKRMHRAVEVGFKASGRLRNQHPRARSRRCSTSWSAKTGSAS